MKYGSWLNLEGSFDYYWLAYTAVQNLILNKFKRLYVMVHILKETGRNSMHP